MRRQWPFALALGFALSSLTLAPAQAPAPQPRPKKTGEAPAKPMDVPTAPAKKGPVPLKKYDDVVTKDAVTSPGVFAVHRIEDRVLFEIPQDAFDRLMLWQAEVVKGSGGSWGGMALGSSVLRWERRANKVYLWKVGFSKRADGKAIQAAVDSANMDAIVAAFNVEAEGKDRSAVVNVTSLFTTDVPDLSVRRAVAGSAGIDGERSYLSKVKAFPTNIEVQSLLTFRGASRSSTAIVHYSLVMLPETPMTGRYFDPRVGYFTESFESYADPKTWVVKRQYITRFRLEKKDPSAAVSEPVKPIVFYLAPEIPEAWRPYFKKGVEDWQPAFEKAGFKNAIICKDAPTRAEDPNWDPEDARYSVIRWVAEPIANAMGPHVHDPRSGEVISAHIIFWHDVVKLAQMWYFVQCSAVDERARKLPLPEDLTGELLRYICAHEVGHTLGLRHNHRASQAYTVKQLRDPKFTATHGSVGSIMSYGRFNYVAQPEDKVKCLIPVLAPYDFFAIEWGYKPVPDAKTAAAERPTLDEWASRQLKEPFLRFGGEDLPASVDPTVLTENIGSDPVEATALGLKNLDRVMGYLASATTAKGEDYELLGEVYQQLMGHRRRWFDAVAKLVGGVTENRTLGGRGGVTFERVPEERQKAAVKFLLENAFTTPAKLIDPQVVQQFRFTGVANEVIAQQRALLVTLLGSGRLNRLFDGELVAGDGAYTAMDLVTDLQNGIWSELDSSAPKIDPVRRQLQRAYIDILKNELNPREPAAGGAIPGPPPPPLPEEFTSRVTELRAVARQALAELRTKVTAAENKGTDVATRAHLRDVAAELNKVLDGGKK